MWSKISSQWRWIFAALFLLAGVLLIARALKGPGRPAPGSTAETLAKVATEDEKRLDEGTAPEAEIIKSLKRHADQGQEQAREFIAKYLAHPSPAVRAAALEAAGNLPGYPFAREINQAFEGPPAPERLGALRALVRAPQGDTLEKIRAFRKKRDLNHAEWYAALTANFKMSNDEKERTELIRQLLNWPVKSADVRSEAFAEFFRSRPGDASLLQLAEKEVTNPQDPESAFYAFNYLADGNVLWLAEHLAGLPVPEHRGHQSSIVDFVNRHCPRGWREVIQALRATKNGKQLRVENQCS